MDTWTMVAEERTRLVGDLANLPGADWDKPSLLPNWNVRQVTGHMIATAQTSPPKFVLRLIGAGFDFNKMSDKNIAATIEGQSAEQLVEAMRSLINSRTSPPGPAPTWLGETIVHGEDIFRALGPYREHPIDHVIAVADFYKDSNLLIHAKSRIADVKLTATDTDWTTGGGPEVQGPLIALVMAMCGRKQTLDDLTGEGVEVLRGRE